MKKVYNKVNKFASISFLRKADYFINPFFYFSLLITIAPFIFISFYNHPSDDDFSCSIINQPIELFPYVKRWYLTHTGRYTSTILWYYCNPVSYKEWNILVKLSPIVFFLLIFTALYLALYSIIGRIVPNKKILISTLYAFVLLLFGMPLIASAFYWFMGASVYTSACIFLLILLSFFPISFKEENSLKKYISILISTFCIFAISGCNESGLTVLLFVLFLLLIFNIYKKDKKVWLYGYFFVIALASSVFSLLAPGNTVRAKGVYGGTLEPAMGFSVLLKYGIKSLYFGATHLAQWSNNGVLWLASLLFIPLGLKLAAKNALTKKYLSYHPVIYFFLLWIILGTSAFVPFVGTGDALDRVWNSSYLFFLMGWFVIIQSLIINYQEKSALLAQQLEGLPRTIIKLLLLFLLFATQDKNINTAFVDLFAKAPEYSLAMQARYQEIELARFRKQNKCEVSPLFEKPYKYPKTLFLSDLTTDPNHWVNKSYSSFFGIDSIYTTHDVMISRHEQY